MKAYSILLIFLSIVMTVLILTRHSIDTHISRAKGQLYQEQPNNRLSNLYTAKIINKTNQEVPVELRLEDMEGTIKLISTHKMILKKEALNEYTFFITIDKVKINKRNNKIKIGVYQNGEKIQTVSSTFLGPFI